MGAPPGAGIPWPNSAIIPPIRVPDALAPVVEGPGIRQMPPDGRRSYSIPMAATPTRVAPLRPWRQGCLLLNEDATNAIRYGEDATLTATSGALLPAATSVILKSSQEIWAVAVASTPKLTVVDEWYSAPPQRQPQGV